MVQSSGVRVVHITPQLFGDEGLIGGGERYPHSLAREMAQHVDTTLIGFGKPRVEHQGPLKLVVLRPQGHAFGSAVAPLSWRVISLIARTDVVHVHQWESVLTNMCVVVARLLGKKVFVTDHGGSSKNYWRRLRLNRLVTGFLWVSAFSGSLYPGVGRSHVIFGGVSAPPDIPELPRDGVVFVGRILPHKGLSVLIDALPQDSSLRIIGHPYDLDYLAGLKARAKGKSVSFEHGLTDPDVRTALMTSRVAVMVSLHEPADGPAAPKSELLGLSAIEAMSCGTPVVVTRTGGLPETVEDNVSGFIVEPHDVAGLRARLDQLCGEPHSVWEEMSRAARRRASEHFSWETVVGRCLDAYDIGTGRNTRDTSDV